MTGFEITMETGALVLAKITFLLLLALIAAPVVRPAAHRAAIWICAFLAIPFIAGSAFLPAVISIDPVRNRDEMANFSRAGKSSESIEARREASPRGSAAPDRSADMEESGDFTEGLGSEG